MKDELLKIIKEEMKKISEERNWINKTEISDSHEGSLFAFINYVSLFVSQINLKYVSFKRKSKKNKEI